MIKINLLPQHLRPVKRSPLPYLASGAILAVAVLAMLGLWVRLQTQIAAKEADRVAHQTQLDTLRPIVDECNQLADQKLRLADKMSIIQEIVSDRIIWSRQLFNIGRLTPDNFWYSGINEKEKTTKEMRLVFDEKTKKEEMKPVTVKHRVLEVSGYVIEGPGGNNDIYPLTLNLEQDKEFASLFQFSSPKLVDTEFKGYRVRSFVLEYLITQGEEATK
jgi:Tfp pilus assembly protein PilN